MAVLSRLLARPDVQSLEAHLVRFCRWCPWLVAQDEHVEEVDPVVCCKEQLEWSQSWDQEVEDLELPDELLQAVLEHFSAQFVGLSLPVREVAPLLWEFQ